MNDLIHGNACLNAATHACGPVCMGMYLFLFPWAMGSSLPRGMHALLYLSLLYVVVSLRDLHSRAEFLGEAGHARAPTTSWLQGALYMRVVFGFCYSMPLRLA